MRGISPGFPPQAAAGHCAADHRCAGGRGGTAADSPAREHYHDFADQRVVLGVPHALNVASNLGFLIVGAVGLGRLWRPGSSFADARERWPHAVFFVSLVGVGFGSAYYHLAPSHGTLFWDRLPMSLAFMSLLSAVLAERLGPRVGLRLFPWLAAATPCRASYRLLRSSVLVR